MSMRVRLLANAAVLGMLSLGATSLANAAVVSFQETPLVIASEAETLGGVLVGAALFTRAQATAMSGGLPFSIGPAGTTAMYCDQFAGCDINPVNGDGDLINLAENADGTTRVVLPANNLISGFNDMIPGDHETLVLVSGSDTSGNTYFTDSSGETATPAPEPATLSLLAVGLFGLAAARRLRRR